MMEKILDHCDGLPERHVSAGETLLVSGESGNGLFVLIQGEIEVFNEGIQINTQTEPGSIFGEMSALLNVPYTADVKALTASRIYEIEDGEAFLRAHPDITLYLATLLARTLKGASDYLVDLKKQFAGQDDHFGIVDEVLSSLLHLPDEECIPGSDRDPDKTI
jgi:CRP-like cAMP-binding protein